MQTSIIIKCDIQDMERIAYACKKVIEQCESARKAEKDYAALKNTTHKWHDKVGYKEDQRVMPLYSAPVLTEVMCSHCDWSGSSQELTLDAEDMETCPKCHHVLTRNDYGLNIFRFMSLDDSEKVKYTLYCDDNEHDIGIFDRNESCSNGMSCECCGVGVNVERTKLIGTRDTREPKFCYNHFITVNMNSRFVKS